MANRLREQGTAVITGGASGIGAATALRFASLGMRVAVLDVNREAGEAMRSSAKERPFTPATFPTPRPWSTSPPRSSRKVRRCACCSLPRD